MELREAPPAGGSAPDVVAQRSGSAAGEVSATKEESNERIRE
jgi:hypothetical protein